MSSEFVSWFEKISLISKKCSLRDIIYYHKGNVIQAPLEALLTFYLAEMIMFVSDLFVREPLSNEQMLQVIIVPLIFSALVCIVYSIAAILKISSRLFECIKEIDTSERIGNKKIYDQVDNRFKDLFFKIHRWGAICYFLVSVTVACYCVYGIGINLKVPSIVFIIAVTIFGSIFGLCWNYAGFNGDRRVDWSLIILSFNRINIRQRSAIIRRKYKHFERQVTTHIIMIIFILGITAYILFFLNGYFEKENEIKFEMYYLFASLYVMTMYLYIRFVFKHFYGRRENGSKIYINIEDLKDYNPRLIYKIKKRKVSIRD
ncbi:hypothetical protein [Desulfitobacterium chlororespirans]|uniref:Uncharacterized protein n=1 Tax=Desulfitobacterium chlororespirans DSM 11544 TaxID=1121395 RepID=A0A1M7UKG8_9FIRM|nr:hypothetical protein [Desulfitobacterium chlororespirans]SHN83531.1 hypothetical protein SAMN02745215_04057 [Desulfitobacterium chlororespirans DSM 11544]